MVGAVPQVFEFAGILFEVENLAVFVVAVDGYFVALVDVGSQVHKCWLVSVLADDVIARGAHVAGPAWQLVLALHDARHVDASGGEECRFDIEWSGEVPPSGAEATATKTLLDEELAASVSGNAPAAEPEPPIVATPQANEEPPRSSVIARLRADGPSAPQVAASAGGGAVAAAALAEQPGVSAAPEVAENVPVEVAPAPKPRPKSKRAAQDEAPAADEGQLAAEMLASVGEDVDGSNDDLFVQLRKRLADADRQARMYAEAQSQIEALRVELSRMRAQAEAEIAAAAKERDDATEAFAELKRRIQSAISDD